ncbi:MAG: hypothetical protein H0Z37_11080 [Firmicutes bacterium]|nr:hypothetical protein [Bacillota bacterium]
MDRDLLRNEGGEGRDGTHIPPSVEASMETLIRTVKEFIFLTANTYPPWLLRLYKRSLYEAASAARRQAVQRRRLLRSIGRNLSLLSDVSDPEAKDATARRRMPARRCKRR